MRGNITHIALVPYKIRRSQPLWQWDYGQVLVLDGLELPYSYEVHFACDESGNSVTQIGGESGVAIPDSLLQVGEPIHVWLYIHTGESDGETEVHGILPVIRRAKPTNTTPTPVQQDVITETIAALNAAVTLAQGIAEAIPGTVNDALAAAKASGEFDGADGADGTTFTPSVSGEGVISWTNDGGKQNPPPVNIKGGKGDPGADGYSPTVSITAITGGYRVSITDKNGTHTADIMNGTQGDPGQDGYSPSASVSKSGKTTTLTVTDKNGTTTAEIKDGEDGDPTTIIDDTAGAGEKNFTWSADKLLPISQDVSSLKSAINAIAVTPEMFGAKGDGATDDTDAINDMFDSGYKNFMFGNKTYLVDGPIDVDFACDIYFNNTKIKAKGSMSTRDFEYIIAFKAYHIHTYGELTVQCNSAVNIGIYLEECGSSIFDSFVVTEARIWGISTDPTTEGNNGLIFNSISVARCGCRVYAKAKYSTSKKLELENITCSSGYFSNNRENLFNNAYRQSCIMIDDSGYLETYNFFGTNTVVQNNRFVFWNVRSNETPFELDEEDPTKGTYTSGQYDQSFSSQYVDGENGRNVLIPIGGGINLQSSTSEGVYTINKLVTQSNPLGARLMMAYSGTIGTYVSEFDTIMMSTNSFGLEIGSLYNEATGYGLNYKFNNGYDKILCLSWQPEARVNVGSTVNSTPFVQGNDVTLSNQVEWSGNSQMNTRVLTCPQYDAGKKCFGIVENWNSDSLTMDVDEFTPSEITIEARGFSPSKTHLKINIIDKKAFNTNRFQPMKIYAKDRLQSSNSRFNIGLASGMENAGYSIEGAVNGIYTINPNDYGSYFLATIVYFPFSKKFHVYSEPISSSGYQITTNLVTSLSNASTDTQYPSAKCIYDIVGNVETLLSGI